MRTGLAETYIGFFHGFPAHRWWIDEKILVGGSILNRADYDHLARDFGVTHVLSVESERCDADHVGVLPQACWLPFPDNGDRISRPVVQGAIQFARTAADGVLYVHCQQGGSRSPSIAYAVLRDRGLNGTDIVDRIRANSPFENWGRHLYHVRYMDSIEENLR